MLFLGNSLTAANDLPAMVASISAAAGAPLQVSSVTLPGASLGDHLDEGSAAARLRDARWDVVVLQQGPSSRPESGVQLRADVARFAPLIRAAGARPALYMVWPVAAEPERWDDVRDHYAAAAADVDGIFLPAGEAWRVAARLDPALQLYTADGLHPTPAGTYAAALVIAAVLTGKSPLGAPVPPGVSPAAAATLQRAAAEVSSRHQGGALAACGEDGFDVDVDVSRSITSSRSNSIASDDGRVATDSGSSADRHLPWRTGGDSSTEIGRSWLKKRCDVSGDVDVDLNLNLNLNGQRRRLTFKFTFRSTSRSRSTFAANFPAGC